MESIEIAKEYYKEVKKIISDVTMILYGSTVFGVKTSDLDLCFFRKEILPESSFNKLKKFTQDFHIYNNLRIDEEIPYENKLIYTYDFIESTFSNPPFPRVNNRIIIPPIQKSKEFLNSIEMRKRLLLNILTVKHMVMGDNLELINEYSIKAWEVILKTVISYSQNQEFTLEDIVSILFKDPYTLDFGELYLGYKDNLMDKVSYINDMADCHLNRLTNEKKLIRTLNKMYIPNESWLKNER